MARSFTDLQLLAGLLAVVLLAVLGGQARLLRLQRALGLEQLLASSFLFVPLGMLLSEAGLGLINRELVRHLEALVTLGLGVLGLLLGLRLDLRRMDASARRLLGAAGIESLVTLVLVGVPLFFLLEIAGSLPAGTRAAAAALLGCTAAISSGKSLHALSRAEPGAPPPPLAQVADQGTVAGVVMAGVLLSVLAPTAGLGRLERLLAVTTVGAVGGLASWLLASETREPALRTALLLGMVLLTAGTAAHLSLPPVACTLAAGVTIRHLPGRLAVEMKNTIEFLEEPLTVLLLVIAGAALRVPSWQSLVILGVYLALRTAGKLLGGRAASTVAPELLPRNMGLGLLPSSAVALGLVLDFHAGVRGPLAETLITTALLGSLLSETAGVWTTRLVTRAAEELRMGKAGRT